MTPQEWIESTKLRWGDSGHLYEGAQHLAAALEEIARLQAQLAQAERVVVPECGYRFNTHCLCAVPASRVLKDGEVAVGAATMTAYRSALSLAEFASEHEIDATWRVSFQSVREHFGALRAQGKEGAT